MRYLCYLSTMNRIKLELPAAQHFIFTTEITPRINDINDLPISFDNGWYEQKAVAVLLALLFLGVKGIRLGPTLPAFLSPTVVNVLVENFNIKPIGTVEDDIAAMMKGE